MLIIANYANFESSNGNEIMINWFSDAAVARTNTEAQTAVDSNEDGLKRVATRKRLLSAIVGVPTKLKKCGKVRKPVAELAILMASCLEKLV